MRAKEQKLEFPAGEGVLILFFLNKYYKLLIHVIKLLL